MARYLPLVLGLYLLFFATTQLEAIESVSGIVTDSSGQPVPEATVLMQGNSSVKETTTSADGKWEFANLPPGSYVVQAFAPDMQAASRSIVLKEGDRLRLTLTLIPVIASETVTVTAEMANELEEVPGGSAIVREEEIRSSAAGHLQDVLDYVPGVMAQSRFGAEESRFSIRGSGLRNNFHMRGLNILINGIPYQDADGFSDFESIDLLATQHIEIWKGSNALRYGANSMGGAVNFVTKTSEAQSRLQLHATGGAYGLFKAQLASAGAHGTFDYYASLSTSELGGFRDYSRQERDRFYSNMGWTFDRTRLGLDVVYANVIEQLPGALTRSEFESNPRQADSSNIKNLYGRSYDYVRASARLDHALNENQQFEFILFGQYRTTDHPIFQILDQDARSFGAELRYRYDASLGGRSNRLVIGFSPQFGRNDERRFQNLNGNRGNLTALFQAKAINYGFYVENQYDLLDNLTWIAGARADIASRKFSDRYLTDGDRSDNNTYRSLSPKLGLLWKVSGDVQVFGNIGRSVEPPLLLELTSFGSPGFLPLESQKAWQYEIGMRGETRAWKWDASVYDIEIEDELINTNVRPFPSAGFTVPSYRNVPRSRHFGLELGAGSSVARNLFDSSDSLQVRMAYTYSRFIFLNDPAYGNNDLPGAPPHMLRAELKYENRDRFWIAPNVEVSPASYFVNSANTVKNDSYLILGAKAGLRWNKVQFYFEGANVTDKVYSGSVQVDNELGRFFEPSNGRSLHAGLHWEM